MEGVVYRARVTPRGALAGALAEAVRAGLEADDAELVAIAARALGELVGGRGSV